MLLSLTLKLSGGNIIFRLCALDPKAQSDARHVGKVAVQFPTRPAKRRLRTNLLEKWMSFRLPYKKGLPFILEMNHPKKEPSIFRGYELCELFFDFYAFFPGKLELVYFCKNLISNLSKILPRYTERNIPPGLKSLSADEGNLVFQSILRFLRECQEDTPPSLTVYPWKVPLRPENGEKKIFQASMATPGAFAVEQGVWATRSSETIDTFGREELRPGRPPTILWTNPIMEHGQR